MSNSYPAWWDTDITIYNRFEDPQTQLITWYRKTISSCFWQDISDKILVGNAVLATNNIICRIPKQSDFLERHEWIALANNQMGNYFTLGVGDIIVRGTVTDTINEYSSGHRATDVLSKYKKLQGCMQIESFAINTDSVRCAEHYYVKGV